jgi:acyl-coenzyme A thioesterase PaaI-like protein
MVFATAKALHLGRTTQVWEIKTTSKEDILINVSRMTLAVVDKNNGR